MTAFSLLHEISNQDKLFVAKNVWPQIRSLLSESEVTSRRKTGIIAGVKANSVLELPDDMEIHRFLDQNWTIFASGDVDGKLEVERLMFETIAENYENEIHPERNRECFHQLLELANVRIGDEVLDFGCGPGLSRGENEQISLTGCEASHSMRRLARANGMRSISPYQLAKMEGDFDASVASYVMHLTIPETDIGNLARSLRIGGRLAANFHKNQGLRVFEEAVKRLTFIVELEELNEDNQYHGALRVWERTR